MRTCTTKAVRRGFTLIEILIVVVILGILAAIVIPQFTDASEEANHSNLLSQLQTVRGQIELYNIQNPANAYDSATAVGTFWDPLVMGNYLQHAPKNPLNGSSTVSTSASSTTAGWYWGTVGGNGWTLNLYAIDATASPPALLDVDGDGSPE